MYILAGEYKGIHNFVNPKDSKLSSEQITIGGKWMLAADCFVVAKLFE